MKKFFVSLAIVLMIPLTLVFAGCKAKVNGIRIFTDNVATEFIVGEEVSTAGLLVELRYTNGTSEDIEDYEVDTTGVDTTKAGEYQVVIKYNKYKQSYTIHYYERGTITAIDNNVYYPGQDFMSANPVLRYTSGKGEVMSAEGCVAVSFDNQTPGDNKVAVLSYLGEEYECTVKVVEEDEYYDYLIGKIRAENRQVFVDAISYTTGSDNNYYISASQGVGAYSKVGDNETWVVRAKVYNKVEGTISEREFMDYDAAVKAAFGLEDGLVDVPVKGLYPSLKNAVVNFKTENLQEQDIAYTFETDGTILTATIASTDGQTSMTFVVNLRTYTIYSLGFVQGGESLTIIINPDFENPPMQEE